MDIHDEKDMTFTEVLFIAALAMMIGFVAGGTFWTHEIRRDAVEHGVAEWVTSEFKWKR